MNTLLALTTVSFGAWQTGSALNQIADRQNKYRVASDRAMELGRSLLVVGGPYGGVSGRWRFYVHLPAHGCGDYCLDINPKACRSCPEILVADVRDIPLPDNSIGVAYVSHVLEHLDTVEDCIKALDELYRVSSEVVISLTSSQSITSRLRIGHKLLLGHRADGSISIRRNGLIAGPPTVYVPSNTKVVRIVNNRSCGW